jgi:hypothetical protein
MALYRIISSNREKTCAFAEIVTAPLQIIDSDVYYTDTKKRSWCCTWDHDNGRFVTDPEIVYSAFGGELCKIILGTGSVYHVERRDGEK